MISDITTIMDKYNGKESRSICCRIQWNTSNKIRPDTDVSSTDTISQKPFFLPSAIQI